MVVRSTPDSVIQACSTERVKSSGRPQENPITRATNMRRLRIDDVIEGGSKGFIRLTGLTVP
jgi:hypothetical protein